MVADIMAPALQMVRISFAGAAWAYLGGMAYILVFWLLIPLLARR